MLSCSSDNCIKDFSVRFFQNPLCEFCSFANLTVIVAKGENHHRPCRKGVRM